MARVSCAHVDWELVWHNDPGLFDRRNQTGIPAPPVLWFARQALAEHGYELILEVQLELIDNELAVAIYGAGVAGLLGDAAWAAAAPLLTTCGANLREPAPDYLAALRADPLMPAIAEPRGHVGRPIAGGLAPATWMSGSYFHTWWSYPTDGHLRDNCGCSAHRPRPAQSDPAR